MFSIYLPSHRENAHTHTHSLLQIDKINGKIKCYVYQENRVIQSGVFSMEFGEDKERTGMFRMESVSKKKWLVTCSKQHGKNCTNECYWKLCWWLNNPNFIV